MKTRVLLALAMIASLLQNGATVTAQVPQTPSAASPGDDSGDARATAVLLQRLEQVARSGNEDQYFELLAPEASRDRATMFADDAFRTASDRVVLQERERQHITRATPPTDVYRLVVDMFAERGDKARIATFQLEVVRAPDRWLIFDQQILSAVDNLYRLAVRRTNQYTARNFTVRAEDITLTLTDGSVFAIEADEETTGLVLLGSGTLHFEPTPETEKGQVRLFSGESAVDTRFEAAYVRMGSLSGHVELSTLTPRAVDPRDLRRAEQVFREESAKSYVLDLADLSRDPWSLLPSFDDFLAEVRTRRYGTLTYARSANEAEDITFFERRRQRNIAVYASAAKLASRGRFYDEDALAAYDVLHYDIDLTVQPDRLWLDGTTTMRLKIKLAAANQLTLRLADSLVVHSIVSDRFGRLFSLRARGQNAVLINLPTSIVSGTELSLTIGYAGRLEPQAPDRETVGQQADSPGFGGDLPSEFLARGEPNYLYSNRSYWYPQAPISDYATAVMHITVPGAYTCVASGTLQPKSPTFVTAVGSQPGKLYRFRAERPVRYLSFVVSRFEDGERVNLAFEPRTLPLSTIVEKPPMAALVMIATDSLPASTTVPVAAPPAVYTSLDLRIESNSRQTARAREYMTRANAIARFYDSILGDIPYDSFTMALTEHTSPGGHSPGYFAVLSQTLPGTPLTWRNDPASFEGFPEFFLAHELAHQWWGQAVGWRNYHEQWLSEGFAQYFAALYAEQARGPDAFGSVLRQLRKWAVDRSDQGPVYLGYRLGHIRNEGRVYRALVYNKGAAVLHMLRRLVGDEDFFKGLRRFYADWRYRKAGTDDFRMAMEAESGRSLERFFERWIYGSTLPSMKMSTRVENGSEGPHLLVRVEQEGEIFDLPLPLTLDFTDRPSQNVIVAVTDRVAEARIPLAGNLRSVDFNRDDGALVEIDRQP
jgi:Peptidase family M1 domain